MAANNDGGEETMGQITHCDTHGCGKRAKCALSLPTREGGMVLFAFACEAHRKRWPTATATALAPTVMARMHGSRV